MSDYVLYATPGTCARVTMIALEEAEVPFEVRLLRIMTGEQNLPEYRALNPKGKVPLLLVDGKPLTENVAILLYLAEKFPQAHLLPSAATGLEHFQAMSDLCFFTATIHPIVTRIGFPQRFADGEEGIKSTHAKAIEAMRSNIDLVEERLSKGEWWYGERWSVLDAYLGWVWACFAVNGFPKEDYPLCMKHVERMTTRPSVQRALAREGEMVKQLKAEGLASGPPPTKV